MGKYTRYVGLDVHARSIVVAVAEAGGEVYAMGKYPNTPEAVRKLIQKLGRADEIRVCYEAGPCGYVLYRQLKNLGVRCDVIAPSLIPKKRGDRVKTDRRDALELAVLLRGGMLTAVWVPEPEHEALRGLVRAREAGKRDQLRARHRLQKFLLRQGKYKPQGVKSWTVKHRGWLKSLRFEHFADEATFADYLHEVDRAKERIERLEQALDRALELCPARVKALVQALQSVRGVAKLTAVTVVTEVGTFTRFASPRLLMGYSGAVPSERTTDSRPRRGAITKTGNAHLRRVLLEAAWTYQRKPNIGAAHRKRMEGVSEDLKAIAWKAQHRLHQRYWRLLGKGKPPQKAATAVARELLGFLWAIGVQAEQQFEAQRQAA